LDVANQPDDLVLDACVGAERMGDTALGTNALDERGEFVGAAARDAGDITFTCETARDGAARGVTRSHHEHRSLFVHCKSPAAGSALLCYGALLSRSSN